MFKRLRAVPSARSRASLIVATLTAMTLFAAACGGEPATGVEAAKARVDTAEQGVDDAKAVLKQARKDFCNETKDYILAIDRYGKLFDDDAATVGDVQTLGADLAQPKAEVESAAQAVFEATDGVAAAKQELQDARADLAAAKASAAGKSPPASPSTTPAPVETKVAQASIDRVHEAEADLAAASRDVSDSTPLTEATETYSSAAFALEVAWINLFADAGCLPNQDAERAAEAVRTYTVAIQTNLKATGYYEGNVDGVYGPKTVKAVESLQRDAGLPVTGLVDQATSMALDAKVAELEGQAAEQAKTQTTAVQTTLKLAGYWDGPIDGEWTPELTAALQRFQTDLGVEPTGAVDAATLAAVEQALNEPPPATAPPTTPPTTEPPATTTGPSTTAPVTTAG
jgi:peptidoglycan hydrolase-like protein with peptidoglycan-binding domain